MASVYYENVTPGFQKYAAQKNTPFISCLHKYVEVTSHSPLVLLASWILQQGREKPGEGSSQGHIQDGWLRSSTQESILSSVTVNTRGPESRAERATGMEAEVRSYMYKIMKKGNGLPEEHRVESFEECLWCRLYGER